MDRYYYILILMMAFASYFAFMAYEYLTTVTERMMPNDFW